MRRWLGLVALGTCGTLALAGPIPPQAEPQQFDLPPFSQKALIATFKGGERALVIASGTGRSPLTLYVYDAVGNCVAHDDVVRPGTVDDVAVEWYPPETGRYTVELRNAGGTANKIQMAIR